MRAEVPSNGSKRTSTRRSTSSLPSGERTRAVNRSQLKSTSIIPASFPDALPLGSHRPVALTLLFNFSLATALPRRAGRADDRSDSREWRPEFCRSTQLRLDLQQAIVFGNALAAAG